MSKVKGFIAGCKVFIHGLKVLIGIKPFAKGDKKLAVAANVLRSYIPMAGVGVVRRQLINAIEADLKKEVKKKPLVTADELLAKALGTPDYMALLKELDMGERDLRFFAGEALRQWGKE